MTRKGLALGPLWRIMCTNDQGPVSIAHHGSTILINFLRCTAHTLPHGLFCSIAHRASFTLGEHQAQIEIHQALIEIAQPTEEEKFTRKAPLCPTLSTQVTGA
jgi:hypothetical protein